MFARRRPTTRKSSFWPSLDKQFDIRLRLLELEDRTAPATFTVTTTADSGAGSLRQAILDANANPGADAIAFNIAGGGVKTISPTTALPQITEAVDINGYTQPGSTINTQPVGSGAILNIVVSGKNAGSGADGLDFNNITTGTSVLRGVAMSGWGNYAALAVGAKVIVSGNRFGTDSTGTTLVGGGSLLVFGGGAARSSTIGGSSPADRNLISTGTASPWGLLLNLDTGTTVRNNYFGTNAAGTAALGNTVGVLLSGANTAVLRDNVISGGDQQAIAMSNNSTATILGNRLGTNAAGTAALMNSTGISVNSGSVATIGDGTAAGRNLISGNLASGISVDSGAAGTTIRGNYIGTDVTGTAALGNGGGFSDSAGVELAGRFFGGSIGVQVGGPAAGDRNVISGNVFNGVHVTGTGFTSTDNVIQGNYIGVGADGATAVPNTGPGIRIDGKATGTQVGGTAAGAGNVISGNAGSGVLVQGAAATGNTIAGNFIGTNAAGTAAVANGLSGVQITDAPSNTIGGTTAAARNLISGNANHGIRITGTGAAGNVIRGNWIGLNAAGTGKIANTNTGVAVFLGASGTLIGGSMAGAGNVISGSAAGNGIFVSDDGTDGTVIFGNYIGTNAAGTAAVPNFAPGVFVGGGAEDTRIGGLTATPGTGAGNVISGNNFHGVTVTDAGTKGTLIRGNLIGLTAAGTGKLGNGNNGSFAGIAVFDGAADTTIGGTDPQARNVISGNENVGIGVLGSSAALTVRGTVIQGNSIGTDITGTVAIGNGRPGVGVFSFTDDTTIGGTATDAGNLISGNAGGGLYIGDLFGTGPVTNVTVLRNFIGTTAAGTAALPNTFQDAQFNGFGMQLEKVSNVTVGGTGNGNLISGNAGAGVEVRGSGNTILSNLIGTNVTGTAAVPNAGDGVLVTGGSNTVRANLISGNTAAGVRLDGATATANTVAGNVIGLTGSGTAALGNAIGVQLTDAANNTIGGTTAADRNVISGNSTGVTVSGAGSTGNVVLGNYIGTNAVGSAAVGNVRGVRIIDGSGGNTIGGLAAGAGNLISGNATAGVGIENTSSSNTVWGNRIGTNAAGAGAVGNFTGVLLSFASNQIVGGTTAAHRNLISGNLGNGVLLNGVSAVTLQGNWIGLNAAGTGDLGNGGNGVILQGGSDGLTIGGTAVGAGNVISGNDAAGVAVSVLGSTIAGNFIGTDSTGTAAVGNQNGVVFTGTAKNNTVGGTAAGARNVISGNIDSGIALNGSGVDGNTIAGNFIGTTLTGNAELANGGNGISLDGAKDTRIGGTTAAARNVIGGNGDGGLLVRAVDTTILGNSIGLGADGNTILGGASHGIRVDTSAVNTIIGDGTVGGRNVIAGGMSAGILISNGATTTIRGNFIGTDASGTKDRSTMTAGIRVESAGTGVLIGGTVPGQGNVLSGANGPNLEFAGTTSGSVQGNVIGLAADGTALIGLTGTQRGIAIRDGAKNILIGGTATGAGNTISGNFIGLDLFASAKAITIQGNRIGTDPTGLIARPNGTGISIRDGATNILIGGDDAADGATDGQVKARNIISGTAGGGANSGIGVLLDGVSDITIAGNWIGLKADGTQLGNNQEGVFVGDSTGVLIGGSTAGAGNLISGNGHAGVELSGSAATGNTVRGNRIGTNAAGDNAIGNGFGVSLVNAPSNFILDNLISGNVNGGLKFQNASLNTIHGNVIGLGADGTTVLGNGGYGVRFGSTAAGNLFGGTAAGQANVVSGNNGPGVLIDSGAATNKLFANYIGTDATGTLDMGNVGAGVQVSTSASLNFIGGSGAGEGNLISGNGGAGVVLNTTGPNGQRVFGNFIGTNKAGTAAIPNADGVVVSSRTNTVGGSAAGEGNLISGNTGDGVRVTGTTAIGTTIAGNRIGTDVTGTAALANGAAGVFVTGGAVNTTVGGSTSAAANVISGNLGRGVHLAGAGIGTVVWNNYIGTTPDGESALGNASDGVRIEGTAGAVVRGNTIAGNLLGVSVVGAASTGNVIAGNFIGTDDDGANKVGTQGAGVIVNTSASGNTIGGTATADRNVIGGHTGAGVQVTGGNTSGNLIAGNSIGLTADGTAAIANATGVLIDNAASNNTVGQALGLIVSMEISEQVIRYGADGLTSTAFTGGGTSSPDDIARGPDGHLYVLNHNASTVSRFDGTTGAFLGTFIPAGSGGLSLPRALLFTGGFLLIASAGSDQVLRYDAATGAFVDVFISGNGLDDPFDLKVGPDGRLYVLSTASQQIKRYNLTTGAFLGNFAVVDTSTVGLAFGPDGDIYTVRYNAATNYVQRYSGSTGAFLGNVVSDPRMANPTDIKFIPDGSFLVTNYFGGTIERFSTAGEYLGTVLSGLNGPNKILLEPIGAGNVIGGNSGSGVRIDAASGNVVAGNRIGTNAAGTAAVANAIGVELQNGAAGNRIGGLAAGNVVSGNTGAGVRITGTGTTGNQVVGSVIGLAADGKTPLGNLTGVDLNNTDGTNTVGGATAAARNVISANAQIGVALLGASGSVVAGNFIGTDASGTLARGNVTGVLSQNGPFGTLGGPTAGHRNVISGNTTVQVLSSNGSAGGSIQGNFIGLSAAGTGLIAGGSAGISTTVSARDGVSILDNVIAGYAVNVNLSDTAAGYELKGNRIGTNAAGTAALGGGIGVQTAGPGTVIGGPTASDRNLISGHTGNGVKVTTTATGTRIEGNYVGTDVTGNAALGNLNGVSVEAANATIRGNVLSGNGKAGVAGGIGLVFGVGGTGAVVTGNIAGLGADGDTVVPNLNYGIGTFGANTIVGGPTAADRNVISGNIDGGFYAGGDGLLFRNNYVGTDATGTQARGNAGGGSGYGVVGVYLQSATNASVDGNVISANAGSAVVVAGASANVELINNRIGTNAAGTAAFGNTSGITLVSAATVGRPGQGNVISGSTIGAGIGLEPTASGSVIQGNRIGTNAAGTAALGNASAGGYGIFLNATANVQVGGGGAGEGNLISGNRYGIGLSFVGNSGNRIQGNLIGTQADGVSPLGNIEYGVWLSTNVAGSVTNNVIGAPLGSSDAALGNTIAFNSKGVLFDAPIGPGNTVRLNRMFSNPAGNWVNALGTPLAPTLDLAVANPTNTRLRGSVSAAANSTGTLDFYEANPGEAAARRLLGSALVPVGPSGSANYDVTVAELISVGSAVTAILTSAAGSSGFGGPRTVLAPINVTVSAPRNAPEGTEVTATSRVSTDRSDSVFRYDWRVVKVGFPEFFARGEDASLVFTPDDNGVYQISLTVTDTVNNEGLIVDAPDLIVTNVVPLVEVKNRDTDQPVSSAAVATGGVLRLAADVSDPGPADQPTLAYLWMVNGQPTATGANFDFSPTSAGEYLVSLRATDKDGGTGSRAVAVTASGQLAASLDVRPGSGTEGTQLTANVSVSGATDNSRLQYAWRVTKNGASFLTAGSAGGQQVPQISFTPDDNGTYRVSLTVTDPATGESAVASTDVQVGNVAPTVTAQRTTAVPALGSPVAFTSIARDPGTNASNDDLVQTKWAVRGPAGFTPPAAGLGAAFAFTPTVPGVYFVTASATDKDGGTGTDTHVLEIVGGTRAVTVAGMPATVVEGQAVPLTASVPGAGAVTFSFTWTVTRNGAAFATGSGAAYTFVPGQEGNYRVSVTAVGSDGSVGVADLTRAVGNAPPVAIIAPSPATVTEGSELLFTAASTDPGGLDDGLTHTWTVTGPGIAGSQTAAGRTFRFTVPDDGGYTVSLKSADPSGAFSTATRALTSTNVAPTVRILNDGTDASATRLKLEVTEPGPIDQATLKYQWKVNGTAVPGATAATFSTTQGGLIAVTVSDNRTSTTVTTQVQRLTTAGLYTVPAPAAGATQVLVVGTAGNNEIDASALSVPVVLDGGAGDDILRGGSGDDVLLAGPGTNKLFGGGGNNLYIGGGNDTMVDGIGNGIFRIHFSKVAIDAGAGGLDTIDLSAVPFGVTLDLNKNTGSPQTVNTANGSTLALTGAFEVLIGTDHADVLTAAAGTTVMGGAGADRLTATGAGATLLGGADGGDTLIADTGAGGTVLVGGEIGSTFLVRAPDASLLGGAGDDGITLTADATRGLIDAGGGKDTLTVNGADFSTLLGGTGDDSITASGTGLLVLGGDGTVGPNGVVLGSGSGSGSDTITLNGDNSTLLGGDGDDILTFTGGTGGVVLGGDGSDRIIQIGGGGLTIDGGAGGDVLVLRSGDGTTLLGGDGDDSIIVGSGGSPLVSGGAGADTLITLSPTGGATLLGGDGDDTLLVNPTGGITITSPDGSTTLLPPGGGGGVYVDGGSNNDLIRLDGGSQSTLLGGSGDDLILTATGSGQLVYGGTGADTLIGVGGGNSSLLGGDGDDFILTSPTVPLTVPGPDGPVNVPSGTGDGYTLIGGSGDDTLMSAGGVGTVLSGGDGSDSLTVTGGINSTLIGGTGDDEYQVGGSAQTPGGQTLPNNSPSGTLTVGGNGDNRYEVAGGSNATLLGGAGDEEFVVRGGTGTVAVGNDGADDFRVTGGSNATLIGGAGDDDFHVSGSASGVRVDGNGGANEAVVAGGTGVLVVGGGDTDVFAVTGGSNVTLIGGAGDDTLIAAGDARGVVLSGGDGNDRLVNGPADNSTLLGGSGDDTVIGPADGPADGVVMLGDTGNDRLISRGGDGVTLLGGTGDDTLLVIGGTGVIGDAGDGQDTLTVLGPSDSSTLLGGSGDDIIILNNAGGAVVGGGDGKDTGTVLGTGGTLYGDGDADNLSAGSGVGFTLLGGTGDEVIVSAGGASGGALSGGTGDDTLTAHSGDHNILVGGDGNDTLVNVAADNTTLYGMAGDDQFDYRGGADGTALGDLSVYGFTGRDTFTVSGGTRVAVYGERGNDTFRVTAGSGVSVYGGSGSDTLRAEGGSDVLLAGNNDNDLLISTGPAPAQLFGGLGADVLFTGGGAGDVLVGEEGDDRYQLTMSATAVTVTLDEARKLGEEEGESFRDSFGFGTDTIDLRTFTTGAVLDLSLVAGKTALASDRQVVAGNVGVVLFGVFDTVFGTPFADRITGNEADNLLFGFDGDDTLIGGAGNDTLAGGAGSNSLTGGTGADVYLFTSGAAGSDLITEAAADPGLDMLDFSPLTLGPRVADQIGVGVNVDLGQSGVQMAGPNRAYTIAGGVGLEGAVGTRFADTLIGTGADDSLVGGDGNDSLVGGAGNDTLAGGAGDDSLFGGSGDDWYNLVPAGTQRLTDPDGTDTLDFLFADRGVTVSLAAAGMQTIDAAGNGLHLIGTFERLLGSSFDDHLIGNAANNEIIGRNGLDTLDGGSAGDNYLQGGFDQMVFLDFVSDTRPGEYAYTAAQVADILSYLNALYEPFAVEFTADAAVAASRSARLGGQYTTVRFNSGQAGGQSDRIDLRNVETAGLVQVNAFDFLVRFLPASNTPAARDAAMTTLSAAIAAHEVGHQLGLRHADAWGPIGTGIFADGSVTRDSFIGSYAPPIGGAETARHVISSPLSLGTPAAALLTGQYFGEREALKLAFTQYGSAVAEPLTPHRTVATAAPLVLQPLIVPNTLRPGDANYGSPAAPNTFAAFAVSVVGRIDLNPATGLAEDDVYAFAGKANETYTFELASTTVKRFAGRQIDGVLKLIDAAGRVIAVNDDDFESQDSLLLDVTLPADGTYYLIVDTFTDASVPDTDSGRYELLAYRMAVGPEAGRGERYITSPGADTVVSGVGPDVIVITPQADDAVVQSRSSRTVVDATQNPSYDPDNVTGPAVIVGISQTPTFITAPITASVAEGGLLTVQYAAANPNGGATGLRYELGADAPVGAAIDPLTGTLSWSPPDDGTFTFAVRAIDPIGGATTVNLTVEVTNVAPAVGITGVPAAPVEGSVMSLAADVLDPSAVDQEAGFTYDWLIQSDTATLLASTSAVVAFTPPDDGIYTVRVTVRDKDGGTTTVTRTISVANVAPTVSVGPNLASVNQGSPVTFTAVAADPSPADTAAGFTFTWKVNGTTVQAGKGLTSFTYTPRTAGTDTVTVTVADNHDSTTAAYQLSVLNVTPTITGLSVPPGRVEGSAVIATLTFTDPGSQAAGGTETYSIFWTAVGSNGHTVTGTSTATGAGPVTFTFIPPDDGTYEIRAVVRENTAAAAADARLLTGVAVANLAPTAAVTGPDTVLIGEPVAFTLFATDPSEADQAAGFTFRIDWDGNGTVDQTVTGPSGTVVTHAFTVYGSATVRVTAVDKDGGVSGVSTLPVFTVPVAFRNGVLTVYGTAGADEVRFKRVSGGAIELRRNDVKFGPFAGVSLIRVYAGAGNDFVSVDNDITVVAELYGEDGRDTLRGGAGNDVLDGGLGDDLLIAVTGDDLLRGGAGNDELRAGAGADTLYGGSGNDELRAAGGNDFLYGEDGDDTLRGGSGFDILRGGDGNDFLQAGSGSDQLFGDAGDDTLRGGSGNDTLDGGTGLGDVLSGGSGDDVLTDPDGVAEVDGGSGDDRINVSFLQPPAGVVVPEVFIDAGSGSDEIILTSLNANLRVNVDAGSGDDRIELHGVWHRATVSGGSGWDRLLDNGDGLLVLNGIEVVN